MKTSDAFSLIQTQLSAGVNVAERAIDGREMPRMAAMHLLGIAGYVRDLATRVLDDLDKDRI